jgi:phosphoenolpyruvate-protein kinase (PTS system EI component)
MVGFAGDGEQQQDASNANTEVILDSLSAVSDDELEQLVAEVRPSLDYGFFQAWTARIEDLQQKGDTAEAQRLTERRSRILELIERMDQEAQAMFEAGTNLLREALNAENPDEVLRAHSEEINEAFMLVLSANIESAQRAGQQDLAERMQEISRLAMEIVQEKLPPDERFINQLMLTEAPEEIGSLLRSNTALITVDFVKKLNEMADEQGNQGNKASAEKLRRLAREAGAMLY